MNPALHYLGELTLFQFCLSLLCSGCILKVLLLLLLLSGNPLWNKKVRILSKGPCLGTAEAESQRSDVHTAPILGGRPRKRKDILGHLCVMEETLIVSLFNPVDLTWDVN